MGTRIIRFDVLSSTPHGTADDLGSPAGIVPFSGDASVVAILGHARPEIVVLPYLLPRGTALDVLRALRARGQPTTVVVVRGIAGRWNEDALVESFANGAAGWASTSEEVDEVVEAAARGERKVAGNFRDEIRQSALDATRPSADPIDLSPVRREIFHYVGCGMEAKEIAALRDRSHRTVQLHFHDIRHQLRYPDHDTLRKQAVRWGHLRPNLIS